MTPYPPTTVAVALAALAGRIADDIETLNGNGRRNSAGIAALTRHRDDVNRLVRMLTGSPSFGIDDDDEDDEDVPGPVKLLAEHLTGLQAGYPPTHPYCGNNSERAGRGDPGHCWVCAVVGHVVAHPQRGCADVQCYSDHDDRAHWVAPDTLAAIANWPLDPLPLDGLRLVPPAS